VRLSLCRSWLPQCSEQSKAMPSEGLWAQSRGSFECPTSTTCLRTVVVERKCFGTITLDVSIHPRRTHQAEKCLVILAKYTLLGDAESPIPLNAMTYHWQKPRKDWCSPSQEPTGLVRRGNFRGTVPSLPDGSSRTSLASTAEKLTTSPSLPGAGSPQPNTRPYLFCRLTQTLLRNLIHV
jgi:hypothetical protein